ncbi:putative RNA-binding Zn-ribbon protein involved in translation (DUF1610 family) [Bradyrhizobium elkanii]|nr:putative RNA-binding Zn-ribbon protein involved in translation (DUF1610 family) [Bradyrhizobium elkanii]
MTDTSCKKATMPGAEPVRVMFVCEGCMAVYEASQVSRRATMYFRCEQCDGIVYRWSGNYDYVQWKRYPKEHGGSADPAPQRGRSSTRAR